MNVAAIFAFLNVAMVLALFAMYFQSWRKVRSSMTAGLILFALFLLVQNAVIIVFWFILYGIVPEAQTIVEAAAPYLTAINALESVALANLVRITWG
jgi:ABC-type transport system involved in multi-copper enzyme maturation permease subunit